MNRWLRNGLACAVPACALASLLAAAQPAAAQPATGRYDVLTGVDVGSHSTYIYAGGVAGLMGPLSQSGPLVRVWADHLSYQFKSGSTRVMARGWGQSVSLGYQFVYATGLVSAYAGVSHRETTVPAGVTSRSKGSKTEARLETDWFQQLSDDLSSHVIGRLVTGTANYWARGRLWYQTPVKIAVAPEITWQGNPDYKAHRFGMAARTPVGRTVSATIDAGYEKNSHFAGGAYGGLSLSIRF
jgi:Cellulose biosynthesis protein BcsS